MLGTVLLICGVAIGMHMGPSADYTFKPLHVHLNLLGFTLMSVFALVYKVFDAMSANVLARVHFWLHCVGSVVLLAGLFLMLKKAASEAVLGPIFMLSELAILIGLLLFLWNTYKNAN